MRTFWYPFNLLDAQIYHDFFKVKKKVEAFTFYSLLNKENQKLFIDLDLLTLLTLPLTPYPKGVRRCQPFLPLQKKRHLTPDT